jgi:hypothetical protein
MPEQLPTINPIGPQTTGVTNDPPAAPKSPASWEEYMASLPDDLQGLYEAHTTGLRNTVQATRSERDALSRQLADITKALGKDPSEAKRLLEQMSSDLDSARLRADFYEIAGRPETGCSNPRLALLAAQEIGAIDAKGRVSWETLKTQFPELFQKRAPDGRAGVGTGTPPPARIDMNAMIRRAAGRQS